MKGRDNQSPPSAIFGSSSREGLMSDLANLSVSELIAIYAYAEAIVETVREPLVILSEDLTVRSANRSFFTTFKVAKEDTYGKKIFTLGNRQWKIPKLEEALLSILPRDTHFEDFEVEHDFERIGRRVMLLNGRRVELEGHGTFLILLAIEDITEKKKIERDKDDFLGIASHELRTPLSSIKNLTELLQIEAEDRGENESADKLALIQKQVDQITAIIDAFTDLFRLQTGKLELHKTYFNIDELVDEVFAIFKVIYRDHALVRKGGSKSRVYADKPRIKQVLTNLISNALKYSPGSNKIIVSVGESKGELKVSVKDFGKGIPADKVKHVLQRFYRVHEKRENKTDGLGLGLFIANEIAKEHGGNITVESRVGEGSTFTLSLPVKK